MKKALLLCLCIPIFVGVIIGLTFFSGKVKAQGGGIIVENADYVSTTTTEYSADLINVAKDVTPRIVLEYMDFNSKLDLNKSDGLNQAAGIVSARIIVEYADFVSTYWLQGSENLTQTATTVKPRIIVEYADFIFTTGLGPKPMEDNTPPTTIISLKGVEGDKGWFTSDVIVTLSATDDISGVDKTEYSFDNIAWTIYTTSFNITTEGNTVIYYHSKDKVGNVETTKTQTIKIDKTAPSGSILVNNGDTYTTSTSVALTLTAADATSGVYQVRFSNDGTWDTEPWETATPTGTWTLMSGDGTKTVYYQIKDNAGLVSITYSDIIILDTTPPSGSITINDGAAYTNSSSITLVLSASDATSGVAQMRFSNNNVAWFDWEAYATPKSWTLTTGDGEKAVYVQFMDGAGLISQSYQGTITLDTTKPTANAGQDQTVNVGATVNFDAGGSNDNVGIVSYQWDFGDGTTGTGKTTTHTYASQGTYTVMLTAKDAAGNSATDTVTLTVLPSEAPPPPAEAFPMWIIGAVIAAIAIAVTAIAVFRRKRKQHVAKG